MQSTLASIRTLLALTLLTGVAYPLAVTGLAQLAWPERARGSLAIRGGAPVGSYQLSQGGASPRYFWPRASVIGHNPLPSSGSNLGPSSAALKKAVEERRAALLAAHPGQGEAPADLLFASSSGLDPHISPEAARYQAARVAAARKLDPAKLLAQVDAHVEGPQWGLFGKPRVNVLRLNLALDAEAQP